jgi:pilus assembly protein CpaF
VPTTDDAVVTDTARLIADRVRRRVHGDGIELNQTNIAAERYVHDEIRRYSEQALGGASPLIEDEGQLKRNIVATLTGLGPLQPYLDDPEIEEIWVNSPARIFVAKNGVAELTSTVLSDREIRDLVERMLQTSGRRVDVSSPFVDASLPDGSRLHVVIPDVTRAHVSVNIRKFRRAIKELNHLVALGSLTQQAAEFLRMCVLARQNILVSGATQAGKTTLLNALLTSARKADRIITVEETFELDLPAHDIVSMQCRQPSLEGGGEITLRRLIKEALRMRPDRIVVGEVREAESLDLLIALNAGLPGACSVHANSATDALAKLCTLPLLAGRNIDSSFVVPAVASCIDVVVHCECNRHGQRRVVEIIAPTGEILGTSVSSETIFALRNNVLEATGEHPSRSTKFESAGLNPAIVLGPSHS